MSAGYTITAGTLLESFETLGDWTKGSGGSIAIDSTYVQVGSHSLKLTATVSSNCFATKTISLDLSAAEVISIDVYIPDLTNVTSITVYLSSTTDLSKFFSRSVTGLVTGWNRIRIYRALWDNTGTDDWANTMIRLRVRVDANAGGSADAYFDNMTYGSYHRPKVIWTCDDGRVTQYDEFYTYAKKYPGFHGSLNVIGSYIDRGLSGYLTLADVQEMYAAGWDINNHTYSHTNMTTLDTQAEMQAIIKQQKDWAVTNGFTRNGMHLCGAYPNGGYNDTVIAAMQAEGMLAFRTVQSQSGINAATPNLNPLRIVTRNLGNTTTLASAKSDVDNAIAAGATLFIESHNFVDTPTTTTEWAITDMQALVDYIQQRKSAGILDVMTTSEWYIGLTANRKIAELQ